MESKKIYKKVYTPPSCLNLSTKAEPMLAGTPHDASVDIGAGGESDTTLVDLGKYNLIWSDHPNSEHSSRSLWDD